MDELFGISWRKILELILSIVTVIIIFASDKVPIEKDIAVLNVLALSYLVLVCVLSVASKTGMISSSACVGMDCALGVMLTVVAAGTGLKRVGEVITLILGIVFMCLTLLA